MMMLRGRFPKVMTALLLLVLGLLSLFSYKYLIPDQKGTIYRSVTNLRGLVSTGGDLFQHNDQQERAHEPAAPERSDLYRRTPPRCGMDTCFDFSRCSIRSGFPVYFYTPQELLSVPSAHFAVSSPPVENSWSWKVYGTRDVDRACAFVLVMAGRDRAARQTVADRSDDSTAGQTSADRSDDSPAGQTAADQLDTFLRSLPHWGKGNHVVINLAAQTDHTSSMEVPPLTFINSHAERQAHAGQVLLAQPSFGSSHFRQNYDIVIPPSPGPGSSGGDVWSKLPPLFPARRKYLVSFWGEYIQAPETGGDNPDQQREPSIVSTLKNVEKALAESGVDARIILSCAGSLSLGSPTEWALCATEGERLQLLSQSTFTLLLPPVLGSGQPVTPSSSSSFQSRLQEALQQGAVPVMLGGWHVVLSALPFGELLHWPAASLALPLPLVRDVPHVLSGFRDSEVLEWRRQGRWLWQTYFSSHHSIVDAALAVLRTRLMIPPAPAPDNPTVSLLAYDTASNITRTANTTADIKRNKKDVASVVQIRSPRFQSNFSYSAELRAWNTPGGNPLFLLPSTPFDPVLPSDAKFRGEKIGREPHRVFSTVLRGNAPQEMFTVMILTYKREISLMRALGRLRGTPFLHKVIVVWNDPAPPSPNLTWPHIGVPVVVTRGQGNSLNNRFLPFDVIETDCVFSLDDDAVLSTDSILLGFRIWRNERERIVGFLSRFHSWDDREGQWSYTGPSDHKEMSIAPTGVTFFHKYYLYLYSYVMPRAVRDHVTEKMNCEDIAMNFLIAHVTRKPPIMVNSKLTFDCPSCSKALSLKSGHLQKRHGCVNLFSKVYGYMPLLFTAFGASFHTPYV